MVIRGAAESCRFADLAYVCEGGEYDEMKPRTLQSVSMSTIWNERKGSVVALGSVGHGSSKTRNHNSGICIYIIAIIVHNCNNNSSTAS
jgi:hypothetical protein